MRVGVEVTPQVGGHLPIGKRGQEEDPAPHQPPQRVLAMALRAGVAVAAAGAVAETFSRF